MMNTYSWAIIVLCLFVLLGNVGNSQQTLRNLGPSAQEKYLRSSTEQRDLNELFTALSLFDNGNYNLIPMYGLLASGFEPHSILMGVRRDFRVRKIYQLLAEMPADRAANMVESAFRSKLTEFKKSIGDSKRYGMHATMFLAFEFGHRDRFNEVFDEWNQWYVEQSKAVESHIMFSKVPEISLSIKKSLFQRAASPELLMYMNLALIDETRKGSTPEKAIARLKGMIEGLKPEHVRLDLPFRLAPLMPFNNDDPEAKPLVVFPEFVGWFGLGYTDAEQRIQMVERIQKRFSGTPGWIEQITETLNKTLVDAATEFQKLLNTEGSDKSLATELESGTRVQFFGPNLAKPQQKFWPAKDSPNKSDMLQAIKQLYEELPETHREQWLDEYVQARNWVKQLEDKGVEAEDRFVIQWPDTFVIEEHNQTSNKDDKSKEQGNEESLSEYAVRIEIVKTTALDGQRIKVQEPERDQSQTDKR